MTETAIRFRDDPWARLPWLVPAALVLTLLSQIAFLSLLRQPGTRSAVPRPVDVQIVELPATLTPPAPPPTPPARRPPLPAKPRAEPPPTPPPPQPEARVEVPRDPTPHAAEEPTTSAPEAAATVPVPPAPAAPGTAVGPATQAAVAALPPSRAPQGAPGGMDNQSARAIYKPMPEIPEALRHRTIEMVAIARFRVAAGGSAQVELIEPTSDPDLNRALLDSLRRWRFFPAMQAGKPMASTLDIRIPISVK
jgi:periplasmic protein TonB